MSRPKVFIGTLISKEAESYIGKFCDYDKWESKENITTDELAARLGDVEGLLVPGHIAVNRKVLDNAPKLKIVSNMSVGYNNFDLETMKERNIIGTFLPHVQDNTVADLVFGLILSSARRICEMDRYVKEGKWVGGDDSHLFGLEVHHSTIGIIGMGRIGAAIAKRAKLGFDMDVLYHNRSKNLEVEEKLGAKYCSLEELLKTSDFVVLMTPLTKETYHLMDAEQFNMMKKTAIFINASRGQTVNEAALIDALQNKKIFAAGLDVFEKEPVDPDNPLLKLPNVVTLPHLGGATEKNRLNMAMVAAKNLVKGVLGEKLDDIVPELR